VFLRIWNLVLKEFIQFLRDWLMTLFILTLPVLQLALMAHTTGSRISGLCAAVLDLDRSNASRRLIMVIDARQELDVCYFPTTLAETHHLLDQGDAAVVAIIPAGFAADMVDISQTPTVQLIADGSNSIAGRNALSGAQGAVTSFTTDLAREAGLLKKNSATIIDLRTTVHYNSTLNVRFFTISAQVGFIVYQVTLVVAAIGLTRERELGTLEQLMVVPLRRVELVIGKAIPPLIIGAVNFLIMLAVAVFRFNVPARGSLTLLFGLTVLFLAVEISYGILISGIARTQQQAVLFVFVMAMMDMTFSGYLVRVKNLPPALQVVAQVVPFSHYLAIIRGVMLKGAGLDSLWPRAAAMLLIGLLIAIVAVRNLSRSLD
jgi:ABC-2 type transport system permease protein